MQVIALTLGILLGAMGLSTLWMPHVAHKNSHLWKWCFHGNVSRVPQWKKHALLHATGIMLLAFSLLAFYCMALL